MFLFHLLFTFLQVSLVISSPTLWVRNNNASKPFTPPGGIGTNSTPPPSYVPMSDFDFQSLNLALNHEWIELDLFHHGLARFPVEEFDAAGIDAEDRYLIQYMAEQEVGHAALITNILGPGAAKPCNYSYPFNTVREFVDFSQKLTRWSEASVYGFLEHLDSRASAELVLQTITVEARQQMILRQFLGAFPMPIWFLPSISQPMAWTLLQQYITSCPDDNPRVEWQVYPLLNVTNNPTLVPFFNTSEIGNSTQPDVTNNRTDPLSVEGRQVQLSWERPGKITGPDRKYTTNTTAGPPRFAAWVSHLNTTYTPLENIDNNTATARQPGGRIYGGNTALAFNGTMFVLIVDQDIFVTPFNFSLINSHVVAGPAVYQAG